MNVLGIGIDEIELARIARAWERHSERFLNHCYTPDEVAFCFRMRDPVPRLAARYAAKEAGAKALGTGLARGVIWREIEVRRTPGQRPTLHFHGRAGERARSMGVRIAHVSLTHCRSLAAATCIVEGDGDAMAPECF
jgi:holo-[acyl-carrier protein] synthase